MIRYIKLPKSDIARSFLTSLAIWSVIAFALMITQLQHTPSESKPISNIEFALRSIYPFTPLFLLSWGLGYLFACAPEKWLQARRMGLLFLFMGLIGLPSLVMWDMVVFLLNSGSSLSGFFAHFKKLPLMWVWIDLLLLSMAMAIHLAMAAFQVNQQRTITLLRSEQDNIRLKLERLQGQLEPHFLFNALNTISALVRSSDRSTAVTALARLSDLLRYALRSSKNNWMSVQDEINFLQDYLALQSLRFSERLRVSFDIQPEQWDIFSCPPLLLQPILENAIRHGLESHEGFCELNIQIKLNNEHIVFMVSNPVPLDAKRLTGHGIGLQATRERLELIFASRASLVTQEINQRYTVSLCIPAKDEH